MRLDIVRDGKRESVEVDLATSTVHVGEHRYPFQVVSEGTDRIELEVGGEKVVVEGWPKGLPEPAGPVDVNGERWRLSGVHAEAAGAGAPTSPTPVPSTPPPSREPLARDVPAADEGEGRAVVPPMPGKIIEVRVHEGDHVAEGQVLVVLEAMKMRNEVPSPVSGRVVRVAVSAGSNVRAHEAMVRIRPD